MTDSEMSRLSKGRKFRKVMKEYKRGSLRSSSGEKVTDEKQALAIAASEQRKQHARLWG